MIITVREWHGAAGDNRILESVSEGVPVRKTAPSYFIEPASEARSSWDMEKHRGHHAVKQYPLWIVGYINKAIRDSSGELFESRYISLSSVAYLTGGQWASGNVLETKATQVKEGTILSLPSAGSQSAAEGMGEQWLMFKDIQWGWQRIAFGWIYTLGIYWAYGLHLIPDERKENFLSIHSIQPCLCA